jgi:hypothetical protein
MKRPNSREDPSRRASRRADKLIMVAVNVNKSALERAKELGIDMVYDNVIKE